MENIEIKDSLDSELQSLYICSIRILNILTVFANFQTFFSKFKLTPLRSDLSSFASFPPWSLSLWTFKLLIELNCFKQNPHCPCLSVKPFKRLKVWSSVQGCAFCDFRKTRFRDYTSFCTSKILRILMEHVESKCDLDSKLETSYICFIIILYNFEVISKTRFSNMIFEISQNAQPWIDIGTH